MKSWISLGLCVWLAACNASAGDSSGTAAVTPVTAGATTATPATPVAVAPVATDPATPAQNCAIKTEPITYAGETRCVEN
jgi:hypothetical protein